MRKAELWLVLGLGVVCPAAGHEVKVLPLGDAVLPLIEADEHLTIDPSTLPLDFGEVAAGLEVLERALS